MSPAKKKAMIDRGRADLSVSRQCRLLKLSRSSLYYTPVGISAETLELMKKIDKVFIYYPVAHACMRVRGLSILWEPSDHGLSAPGQCHRGSPQGSTHNGQNGP
jgi:hypothetical protein